jgi:hypothetical protein
MTGMTLDATGAAELAEMLQFLAGWLQRAPNCLRASPEDFAAIPPRPPACCAGGVRGGGGSAELANLERVDVLLEGNSFAAVHGPHVAIFTTAGSPELLCFHR